MESLQAALILQGSESRYPRTGCPLRASCRQLSSASGEERRHDAYTPPISVCQIPVLDTARHPLVPAIDVKTNTETGDQQCSDVKSQPRLSSARLPKGFRSTRSFCRC